MLRRLFSRAAAPAVAALGVVTVLAVPARAAVDDPSPAHLPVVQGPVVQGTVIAGPRHFDPAAAGTVQAFSAGLPFSYSIAFRWSVSTRAFYTSTGTVCDETYIPSYGGAANYYYVSLHRSSNGAQIGPTAQYYNGSWVTYCWGGAPTGTDLYVHFTKPDDGYQYSGSGDVYQIN
ncbi:MAG: hypothetical protein ACJ73S_24430 [Mycobacteriales bacterium]